MKITVCKYDPSTDEAPYYIEGEIAYKDNMTALQALVDFHENVAPVSFDYSCAGRLCGRCSMLVDGVPCLVCSKKIDDTDHTFEPLPGYSIIRDLIVDKSAADKALEPLWDRKAIEEMTVAQSRGPVDFDYENRALFYPLEFCSRCGACTSVCPAHAANPDGYAGPMAMIASAYRHFDPHDKADRLIEVTTNGLFYCIECGTCDTVCANPDIRHVDLFQLLKARAAEAGYKPSYA